MALRNSRRSFNPEFWTFARNSLTMASITAVLAILIALLLAYGERIRPNWLNKLATRIASMGYAVPGSVIAVSILISFGWLDNQIDGFSERVFGVSTGLLLSGTMVGLIFAYLVRFLTAAFNTLEAGLKAITPSMDNAARSLGKHSLSRLLNIHIPLLRTSLLSAAIFVFVDTMKELPATLIVRPFNLDTLAIRVYRLASDERLVEASGGALAIVVVGLLPVILLSLAISRSRARKL
jgi:iron(III) transport system permease protein